MKLVAYLLLCSSIQAAPATDDFSSIPLHDSVKANGEKNQGGMSFKFHLERHNTYKDIVKEQLFSSFLENEPLVQGSHQEDAEQPDAEEAPADPEKEEEDEIEDEKYKNKILPDSIGFELKNFEKLAYYTRLYVGSEEKEIKVAFDTMVPMSVFSSYDCDGCLNDGYDYRDSTSIRKISDDKISFQIENAKAKGILVYDDIKLEKGEDKPFVKQFPFMLTNQITNGTIEHIDGLIGLSKSYFMLNGQYRGSAFLNSLYESGMINRKAWAVEYFVDALQVVQMGLPSKDEKELKAMGIVYFDTPYKQNWELRINAFRVGEKAKFEDGSEAQFYFEEKAAVLDTYAPYILLPKSLSSKMLKVLFKSVDGI